MATLEVHDARYGVRRVRITRDSPVMFGTDPMCDVVVEAPGIMPFHGRIRWKTKSYKVDASPDVHAIEVNGKLVKSKSLYQGDEIRIGACRIFLLSLDDGPDHGEKTVVRDAPLAGRSPGGLPDFHMIEMAPPSVEIPISRPPKAKPPKPEKRKKSKKYDMSRALDDDPPEDLLSQSAILRDALNSGGEVTVLPSKARKSKAKGLMPALDRAPGDDRVFRSPVVLGLVGTFVALVLFSFALWVGIGRINARRLYETSIDQFDKGEFRDSIRGFDQFLAANPDDERSPKARVIRALARVRQHTGPVGASWGNAVKQARAMVEEVAGVPAYRDFSVDLAGEVLKAAEGLADRARESADGSILVEAEDAVSLHRSVAGQAAESLLSRSRVPEKLGKARAAIRKSLDRGEAIAAMDAAIKADRPGDAYFARASLVRRYADLSADKAIATRLVQANDLVRKSVSFDPSGHPAETEPNREKLGPPLSLVLRLDVPKPPAANPNGPVAMAMADGMAFGIDATTGAPRWQATVGPSCPFPPMAIAGDPPTALVVDARSDELVRINARTGALIWRQELGGPVVDPPMVLGNQVFQPTPDGRLLQLDLASGALRGTLRLGRKVTRTPLADDSAQHLYLLGEEDCLFILTLDPLACVAVEYLGHPAGSVPCPPAKVGRFLVLPENQAIDSGRLRVFVLDESGLRLKESQVLPVAGWTRSTPSSSGPVIWSSSDRGELIAYAIGLYDSKSPLTAVARVAAGKALEGPAFPKARSERDFWLASSRTGRYELDLERGKLSPVWTLGDAGPALAPIQSFDRLAVLTQQSLEGPGTALWGVDPASGNVRWQTILGAPWPSPLRISDKGDALTTLGLDGRSVSLDPALLRSGGFTEQVLPARGAFRLAGEQSRRIDVEGATVVVLEPGASRIMVRVEGGDFKAVDLPAPLAAMPIARGKDLLVPGLDGRVYLIDPRSGTSVADPYVPPFDRSRPVRWRRPVAIDGEAFALTDTDLTIRRLTVATSSRPRLVVGIERKLEKPAEADPASTGAALILVTEDGKVRSLASRDLGPQGTWALEAPRLFGPVVVAGHAFVADSGGTVLAFAPDGHRLWSVKLRDTLPAGPPVILADSAWFLGRDGSIQRFALADGAVQGRTPLAIFPAGGPLASGADLVIPTGLGTVRVLGASEEPKP